jgi:hypothetical protein
VIKMPVTPSEEDIITAVEIIRQDDPNMGRTKMLARLKQEYKWALTDRRLRKVLEYPPEQDRSVEGELDELRQAMLRRMAATCSPVPIPQPTWSMRECTVRT